MSDFKYVGGGYFRDASVPKGQPAETLHGDAAIAHLRAELAGEKASHETAKRLLEHVQKWWGDEKLAKPIDEKELADVSQNLACAAAFEAGQWRERWARIRTSP